MKPTFLLWFITNTVIGCGILHAQQPEQKAAPGLKGPNQTTASPRQTKQPTRKPVIQDLSGFDLLPSGKQSKQHTAAAASRGFRQPVALAPRLGKLYGPNPVFAWNYEGKAQKFVFVLRDNAQQEVFRTEVTGNKFRYPENAPPLQPERTYFWTVEFPSSIFGSTQSAPVGFIVVSAGQREEIEKALAKSTSSDAYQAGLARARVFTDYRLWYDVLNAYSDLIARYPDRVKLYEQRGTIYAQLDVTQKLANQDFAKGEEVQHEK